MRAGLHLLRFVAAVAVLGPAVGVHAQGWLGDRSRSEGRGIRLGDFELHPGIGSELGYDSNVFLSDQNEQDSVAMRVAPHLYLSTLTGERAQAGGAPPPRVRFRTGLSGRLRHYFATEAGTDLGIGQDARLHLLPERVFNIELFEEYTRSIDPFVDPAGPTATGSADYGRDQLGLGTKLNLQSRGGLLKGSLGYRLDVDHFEGDEFRDSRSRQHTFSADSVYEFLPKTGIFWSGQVGLHGYVNDSVLSGARRSDGTLVSTRAGINGGLTDKIGFTLAAGYGAGFFSDDNDYENVVGQVEARYRPVPSTVWTLGYDREYTTAFQGNYLRIDRPRTSLQVMFGGVVLLVGRVALTFTDFGSDPLDTGDARNDIHLATNLQGEYRFTDWLAATVELGYVHNFSDYEFFGTDGAEYEQWQAWLGMRAFL